MGILKLLVAVVAASAVLGYGMLAGANKYFTYYVVYPLKNKIDEFIVEARRPVMEFSQESETQELVTDSELWQQVILPPAQVLDKETFLNNFTLSWAQIESDKVGKIGAAVFSDSEVRVINQNDSGIHAIAGLQYDVLYNGGVKAMFEVEGQEYAYIAFIDDTCASARIVSLPEGKNLYQLPCLPEEKTPMGVPKRIDFNAAGGAVLPLDENSLLLSTGTPTDTSDDIRALAQDDNSPWGKILKITIIEGKVDVSIFSKGFRNPQGIAKFNNAIYAVDHGPMGGDEVNLIEENRNYGWPEQSLGSYYDGAPMNKDYGDADKVEKPLLAFIPSIATSYIGQCPSVYAEYYLPYSCVALSTLRDESLYFLIIEPDHNVLFAERVYLGSRIRKFEITENKLTAVTDNKGIIVGQFTPP